MGLARPDTSVSAEAKGEDASSYSGEGKQSAQTCHLLCNKAAISALLSFGFRNDFWRIRLSTAHKRLPLVNTEWLYHSSTHIQFTQERQFL